MTNKEANSEFYIKSGSTGFANRQRDIFNQLALLEKEQSEEQQVRPRLLRILNEEAADEQLSTSVFRKPKVTLKRNLSETKQFLGQESIFKSPDEPAPHFHPQSTTIARPTRPRANCIPDYHKNPHKWTKYSLDDVSKEDMSNHSNTAAAFSFLREVAARKEAEQGGGDEHKDSCGEKITFKRPKHTAAAGVQDDSSESTVEDKPLFKSSKLVMPEYIVGQSKKKERKRKPVPKSERTEVPLNHLFVEEEESLTE